MYLLLQYYQMKKRFNQLTQTGSAGNMSRVDRRILQVMIEEADIVGDTIGSSSAGIQVKGKFISNT